MVHSFTPTLIFTLGYETWPIKVEITLLECYRLASTGQSFSQSELAAKRPCDTVGANRY